MDFLAKRLGKLGKSKSRSNNNAIGDLEILKHSYLKDFKVQYGKPLGEGLSGKVRAVISLATQEKFAMKILPDNFESRAEIELQVRCAHPNVARIERLYSNVIDGRRKLVVIMELVPGEDLFDRILRRDDQHLSEKRVADIVRSLCQVIAHLHSLNVAHRDVKPENVLMTSKNDDEAEIKLIDFGFAKVSLGSDSMETPCFTPYYAAPEVLSDGRYGKECDAWSIGVLTYILMCGYPPFSASKKGTGARPSFSKGMQDRIQAGTYKYPASDWSQVSKEGMDFIHSLLTTDPAKRMTVQQALEHDWLRSVSSTRTSPLLPRALRQKVEAAAKLDTKPKSEPEMDVPSEVQSSDAIASKAETASTDTGISLGSDVSVPTSANSGLSTRSSSPLSDEESSGRKALTVIAPIGTLTNPLLERRRARKSDSSLATPPASSPTRSGSPASLDSGISTAAAVAEYNPLPDPSVGLPLVWV